MTKGGLRAMGRRSRQICLFVFAFLGSPTLVTYDAAAQGVPKACLKLVADGKAHISLFESSATKLALSGTAGDCRDRLAEFVRTIDAIEQAHNELLSNRCTVDPRFEPAEQQKARESATRWERICAQFDTRPPVEDSTKADRRPGNKSIAWWQVFAAGAKSTPGALVWIVFLSLLALVLLSIAIGRLTQSGRAAAHFGASPADRRGAQDPPTAALETIDFVPVEGGRPYPMEAWRLEGDGITLGRDPKQCDVVVLDRYVSSRHARIWRDREGVHIQDLGSTNGVWSQGRRIAKCTVADGEVIRLGQTTFRVYSSKPSA
jgi:hypothetical protein